MRSGIRVVALLLAVVILAAMSARAATHAADSTVGDLQVTTDPPGAAVYVDGEWQATSPCRIANVATGEVEVRAVLQGYGTTTRTVTVKGGDVAAVDLTLERLTDVGSIAVQVEPAGALVEIDRVPSGTSPTVVPNVPAGTHRVVVSAPGFRPLYTTLTVTRNQQFELRGRLEPADAGASAATAPDLDSLGVLDEKSVPLPQDLPEGQAFDPVRTLVAKRQYDAALQKLDAMAAAPDARRYALRIGQDRRFIRRFQELRTQAYAQLARAKGQDYVLQLRHGIRLAGRIVEVTDEHVGLAVGGTERDIAIDRVSAAQIIRLAEVSSDSPTEPADRITFALLHAAEGEFDEAYEHLRAAAMGGCDITAARAYVDAEHLWAAAVQKEAADAFRARTAGLDPRQIPRPSAQPVPLLIDTYRGRQPPDPIPALLADEGKFMLRTLDRPVGAEDAGQPAVLLIADAGAGRPLPAFDRQEVQAVVDLVQGGGGLVFFGAARPESNGPHPYAPLLRWFGIVVRTDELSVSKDAPKDYPKQWALGLASAAHPVTQRVRQAAFPIDSPSLATEDAAWILMRAPPFVGSRQAGEAAPALVAARTFGQGRVLVFASVPERSRRASAGSSSGESDVEQLIADGLAWVSAPARREGAGTP